MYSLCQGASNGGSGIAIGIGKSGVGKCNCDLERSLPNHSQCRQQTDQEQRQEHAGYPGRSFHTA